MRAAITPNYGSPDVLQIKEIPTPAPGPGQLLVEIHASPVHEGDRRMRSADFPGVSWLPGLLMMGVLRPRRAVQGSIFAGRVVALGEGVERFQVGDRVFGNADGGGAYAEHLVISAEGPVALMPPSMGFAEAAALPYGAGTALTFLAEMAQVKAGERVLILGASGEVGRYAVQIAKHRGAHVTGVCSGRSADIAREAGVDALIDYQREDFRASGQLYDVIFDTSNTVGFRQVRGSLSPQGRYLTLFVSLAVVFQMLFTSLVGGKRALFGVAMGSQERLAHLGALWEEGVITPRIDRRFPMAEIAQAHAHQGSKARRGTVMVEMASPQRLRAVA